jgi:predicted dehydrogenase
MSMTTNRRSFLFGASVAGFGVLVQGKKSLAWGVGPNDTLNIACVGVGGKGKGDTEQAARVGRVVAVCDIDQVRLDEMAGKQKEAKKYNDYRELLHELGNQVDAVIVSTPDHTHAPAAVMAMRMGKHVYCQKPLAHSVWEARLMRETARQKGVCTQMGNQGTADSGFRGAVELVRSGALGEVKEVHVWTNRPFNYWKQAPDIVARSQESVPIPSHVHWDLFLGTAPERPYNPVYHPHNWRGWWDFGTGALGDMACHTTNLPFMALQLGLPVRVSAKSGEINPETYPAWATITYEFPARGNLPPVKLTWYEGAKDGKRNLPPSSIFPDRGLAPSDSGSVIVGSRYRMYSPNDYGAKQVVWPKEGYVELKAPEQTLPRHERGRDIDANQKREWVTAIRAGKPAMALSNFDYAATLTESMLLGNIATRSGKAIEGTKKPEWAGAIDYNPETGEITNNSEASRYLKSYFRKGWEI